MFSDKSVIGTSEEPTQVWRSTYASQGGRGRMLNSNNSLLRNDREGMVSQRIDGSYGWATNRDGRTFNVPSLALNTPKELKMIYPFSCNGTWHLYPPKEQEQLAYINGLLDNGYGDWLQLDNGSTIIGNFIFEGSNLLDNCYLENNSETPIIIRDCHLVDSSITRALNYAYPVAPKDKSECLTFDEVSAEACHFYDYSNTKSLDGFEEKPDTNKHISALVKRSNLRFVNAMVSPRGLRIEDSIIGGAVISGSSEIVDSKIESGGCLQKSSPHALTRLKLARTGDYIVKAPVEAYKSAKANRCQIVNSALDQVDLHNSARHLTIMNTQMKKEDLTYSPADHENPRADTLVIADGKEIHDIPAIGLRDYLYTVRAGADIMGRDEEVQYTKDITPYLLKTNRYCDYVPFLFENEHNQLEEVQPLYPMLEVTPAPKEAETVSEQKDDLSIGL